MYKYHKANRRISIHALREEGDIRMMLWAVRKGEFLSTPSARRATKPSYVTGEMRSFLSTPSARRATHNGHAHMLTNCISIHALREEGDFQAFLPSPQSNGISIHALREEGDPIPDFPENPI